jgi:hypothetical protein
MAFDTMTPIVQELMIRYGKMFVNGFSNSAIPQRFASLRDADLRRRANGHEEVKGVLPIPGLRSFRCPKFARLPCGFLSVRGYCSVSQDLSPAPSQFSGDGPDI